MTKRYTRVLAGMLILALAIIIVSPVSAAPFAYITNHNYKTVTVIATSTNTVTGNPVTVGDRPSGVAVTPDGSKAYVANYGSGTVTVIATSTNTIIGSPVAVGNYPIGLGTFPPATPVPSITTPVYAGVTSVSGTASNGATILLSINSVVRPAVTADPATGAWTVTVPAVSTGDSISVTARVTGKLVSAKATCTVVAVPVPGFTSIVPSSGPVAGETAVTITGTGFISTTSVTIGGIAATGVSVGGGGTTITATTPAHVAGVADDVITTPDGSGTGTGAYTYLPVPTIGSISPSSGPTAGGTSVIITGTGFTAASAVTFDGSAAGSITVNSATQITATVPAHGVGAVNVVVTTAGGTATGVGAYTYVTSAAPVTGSSADTSGDYGRATSYASSSAGTPAGGTMTFGIGEPLSAGGVSYPYAITSVSLVPAGGLGSTDLTVTDAGASAPAPGGRTTAGVVAISPVAVNPSSISSGTITFAVSGAWLSAHGIAPSDIVLMRFHDGIWTELPTTYQYPSGNASYFTATTPGFLYFAISTRTAGVTAVNASGAATVVAETVARTTSSPSTPDPQQVTYQKTGTPAAEQTTAAPAAVPEPAGSSGFPFMPATLIGASCVVLLGSGWWVRRWWIRRQNPVLFREYD